MLSLRAEKQKLYNKTENRSVCVCVLAGNLDTEQRAQGECKQLNFWVSVLV